jgi:polysaccharide export outer membrane protein
MAGTREYARPKTRLRAGLTLMLVGLAGGCSSLPEEKYTFESLPRTYLAAKRENPHTLDLTRLASATQSSDVFDRGDVVKVSIAASLNSKDTIEFPVRIHEDGMATLPVIGRIALAGLEPEAAEAAIVAACMERELYRNPHVTVTMERQRTNKVMVVGAVKQPSLYELPRGKSDLLSALVAAGGLSDDAGVNVEIRNPTRDLPGAEPARIAEGDEDGGVNAVGHSAAAGGMMNSVRVNLISATQAGSGQYALEDGGVVHVEKRDPEPIFVQGLVAKPDRYDYPPAEELRLLGAISMAGGLSNPAADEVYVIRRKPNSTESFIVNLKISDAKRSEQANLLLSPGDVVSVEQTPGTFMMDVFRRINFGIGATLPMTMFF